MAFMISGDIHGTLDIGKIVKYFDEHEDEYTADDYLIICGDVRVCGFFCFRRGQESHNFARPSRNCVVY